MTSIDERPLDRLLDPPRRIGRESRALRRVEPFDRPDQADIAFFDEIANGQASPHVVLADRNNEPQIRPDHMILGLEVVVVDNPPAKGLFLSSSQQGNLIDIAKIDLKIAVR